MTKPDDIPQDVWDATDAIGESVLGRHTAGFVMWPLAIPAREIAARAILAERERCADCCDQWLAMFGDRGAELQHTSPQEWANVAVSDIAVAIRKGGE